MGHKYGKYCSRICYLNSNPLHPWRKGATWGGMRRGENNPNVKYSIDVIKEIKILLKTERVKDIANKFNIRQNYISAIKNGYVWSHIS
jgi:hypothetical protein